MFTNEYLRMGDFFFAMFCNQSKRHFAPMELDFSGFLCPWFCNQGNQCFAPSELSIIQPHRGVLLVTPSVSSVREVTNHRNKPHSGDTFVTPSVSSVNIKTNNQATSWRNTNYYGK
ncbi:MAG: hypothetical protein PHV20_08560 [Bacteroidales bacterium]|nr:hypothetical protein [Bacteroidales bacterium]